MKQTAILSMMLLFFQSPAFGRPPGPDDFAFGTELIPPAGAAIGQVSLPETLYRHVTRSDLGDLRVFNAAGEMVPHMLRQPRPSEGESPDPAELSFFPVYENPKNPEGRLTLQITTDENGAILRTQPRQTGLASDRVSAYLIDATSLDTLPGQLVLDWRQTAESFVVNVSVSGSDDLTRWRSLVPQTTLARLRYGGHALGRHTLSLPPRPARYLRISWPEEAKDARLTKVRAVFSPRKIARQRRYQRIEAVVSPDQAHVYDFDAGGRFYADSVSLRLPERNSLVRGVLKSRKDAAAIWHVRHRGIFYHLTVDDANITSPAISVSPTSDRYWRLETGPDDGGMGEKPPVLELGWLPHELLFLARGKGPFMLAYGSARIGPSAQPVHALLQALDDSKNEALVKAARLGETLRLAGEAVLKPLPPPLPWKEWVLWAVLMTGAGLLGWMAWRLFRQMNPEG
ncbi:DUF3999 domain-containing protein [Desulfonema ishimotonii]|uniref:DUF3999 domain-containing protein n=2 Tax=Desulfonema ishimotonii TaxID=45657 RepID=A0A401FZZ0_9BACT|nr:DUF3999 domain-containing protein [Desulfonema ishimotonii]